MAKVTNAIKNSFRDLNDKMTIEKPGPYASAEELLKTVQLGDLIQFRRTGYVHWGMYSGNQTIIHLINTGEKGVLPRPEATDNKNGEPVSEDNTLNENVENINEEPKTNDNENGDMLSINNVENNNGEQETTENENQNNASIENVENNNKELNLETTEENGEHISESIASTENDVENNNQTNKADKTNSKKNKKKKQKEVLIAMVVMSKLLDVENIGCRVNNREKMVERWAKRKPKNPEEMFERRTPEEVLSAARMMLLEEMPYDLKNKNCEHICTKWKYNISDSDQVNQAYNAAKIAAATAALALGASAVGVGVHLAMQEAERQKAEAEKKAAEAKEKASAMIPKF